MPRDETELEKKWREAHRLSPLPNCEGCTIDICTTVDVSNYRAMCRKVMVECGFIKKRPS